MKKETFVVIDGNSVIHRAFHALPPLKNKKGEVVNAVYGFLLVLFKIIKEFNPEYLGICFDLAEPTFRKQAYKEYKAKRKKAPQELYDQIPKIKEILKVFNISICEKSGFEGDDVIGTIVNQFSDFNNIIVSGDLDTLQLVNKNTKVYFLSRGVKEALLYDEESVKKKYMGLDKEKLIDFKALRGDLSDNIPGVKGIGEKTAIELITTFKNIENIYENINDQNISNSVRKKLIEGKENAFLSKDLAKIRTDISLDLCLQDYKWKNYNPKALEKALEEHGFSSLVKKIPGLNNTGENLKLW
ncbi:MAG TPA: 5'-3' exonuclease H3TH domain-containing protein [Candidatus Pacearchaeota archaeon]|nr:5'-3' exonuclease H3TH domain-containing protein [Candidatus Pacearchaeota archaeon]